MITMVELMIEFVKYAKELENEFSTAKVEIPTA